VEWRKSEELTARLVNNKRVKIVGNRLLIDKYSSVEDNGHYVCLAYRQTYSGNASWHLQSPKPTISISKLPLEHEEKPIVELTCFYPGRLL
jgi:hypothetical protein